MMVNIYDKDFTMTTSSSDILELLMSRIDDPLYNTSYPVHPSDWSKYETEGKLAFRLSKPIAFYIHIPFCRQICSFCEYSKIILPSGGMQAKYLDTLGHDISDFLTDNVPLKLYGCDIGGGTPTALDDPIFEELMNMYLTTINQCDVTEDFEPSVEGTFQTLTEHKVKVISSVGIHRISLGMQSSSESVLTPLKRRTENMETMRRVMAYAHRNGIRKINIDLMYGLPGQSLESIKADIRTISILRPEQVTVYELRTNQLNTNYRINGSLCYEQYCLLYEGLTKLGYFGTFGQNTFSMDSEDKGLSSYLRHRMFDGWQYKGFGASAQSMSKSGISYNIGKDIARLTISLKADSFESTRHYALPPNELLAKFIAISGYSGGFSLRAAKDIYGESFKKDIIPIIAAIGNEGLIEIKDDRVQLTRNGYKYYGPLLSLFYPKL